MHILITGGTGFFGRALLRHWSAACEPRIYGARFTVMSRAPEAFRTKYSDLYTGLDVRFVTGNIESPTAIPEDDYTHILHAATDSTNGLALTPLQRFTQIVNGTRNILDLAVRSGRPRVLITSSGGAYGPQPPNLPTIPESYQAMPDPLAPQNAYGVGKRMAEHLAALYADAYGLDVVIARCFAFVGEDLPLNAHFAIGNFLRDALAGKDIVIQGDGSPIRSYLDQRDLAHWLTTMLVCGAAGRAYNVGSDEAVSILEIAERVASLAPGRQPQIHVLQKNIEGQAAQRQVYLPNIQRAKEELQLQVEIALDESIRHVFSRLA